LTDETDSIDPSDKNESFYKLVICDSISGEFNQKNRDCREHDRGGAKRKTRTICELLADLSTFIANSQLRFDNLNSVFKFLGFDRQLLDLGFKVADTGLFALIQIASSQYQNANCDWEKRLRNSCEIFHGFKAF